MSGASSTAVQDAGPRNKTSEVLAKVSTSPIPGQLLATPTYLLSDGRCEELWTVNLQGTIAKGHCGSWISDVATGETYGHLIAGSPGSGSRKQKP
jgi:hypothetical protein